MQNLKSYLRKNTSLAEIIILLVGVVGIIIGELLQSPVVISLGASIASSAVVVFMMDALVGGNEAESVKRWGLEAVYRTRGEMNNSCDKYFSSTMSVSIIAFGLKSWRDAQQKQIEQLLDRGGNIRIITMKPDTPLLRAREKDEHVVDGAISDQIRKLAEWAKDENKKGRKGKISVKWHEHLPLEFLFLMDNRLFTGPYEYGKDSQQSLSFEYGSTGDAFNYYKEYFERLWNDSSFCTNSLI